MRVSISENIIYGDQNILLRGLSSRRGKLLPSFGSQGESGVTNGNGERLNFPALSGSRRVAGSKVNSLPFWTRLMFLLWRCRVSPEIAIKSFSEHKYTGQTLLSRADPTSISQRAAWPSGGETSKSLHRVTSELLQREQDPTDVLKVFNVSGFFLARHNLTCARLLDIYLFRTDWLFMYIYYSQELVSFKM